MLNTKNNSSYFFWNDEWNQPPKKYKYGKIY